MFLSFSGTKCTGIFLLIKKFLFLVPSKHKLASSKLVHYIFIRFLTRVSLSSLR